MLYDTASLEIEEEDLLDLGDESSVDDQDQARRLLVRTSGSVLIIPHLHLYRRIICTTTWIRKVKS